MSKKWMFFQNVDKDIKKKVKKKNGVEIVKYLSIEGNCAVGCNVDGRLEIFVRGSDNHLWHLSQKRQNGDWSDWGDLLSTHKLLGDAITGNCAVGNAANGRLELFVRSSDNHLWHLWQDRPNGDWCDDCEDLSKSLRQDIIGDCAVGNAADGSLEIYVRGSDNHLWHLSQDGPNGAWTGWEDLSTYRPLEKDIIGDCAVGSADNNRVRSGADGRMEIFIRGSDNHLWHLWQDGPNGRWTDWQDLGESIIGNCTVEHADAGYLEIFVRAIDNHLWHLWQKGPNRGWYDWQDLSTHRPLRKAIIGDCAVGRAADGSLEIFVRGSDNHLWHLWQKEPNGDWCDDWQDLSTHKPLGKPIVGDCTVGTAKDGHLEIFVRSSDNHLLHLWQTSPNGDWSNWEDLSTYSPLKIAIKVPQ